jgi:cytochrome c oxidase subunit 3
MTGPTPGSEATVAPATRRAAPRGRALPNGMWGMWLLVATEATLFGTLLGTYYYLRFKATSWPPPGIPAPSVALPLVLTACLVATTVPVFFAARAAKQGRRGLCWWLLLFAMAVQVGYLVVQGIEFGRDLDKFSGSGSAYGSIYFTMLATHHLHVLLGVLLDLGVLALLTRGLTNYRVIGVRAVALYWYFVNTVAVFVVLTQLSPSL